MWAISIVLALISTDLASTTCQPNGPVLRRVLETEELVKQSSHCVAPKMPALLRQARFQGGVIVRILVDPEGRVVCVKAIKGHPLVVLAAVDAAKKWTFRPMTQRGRPVSFFGHLTFQFSASGDSAPTSCTSAHW